MTWSKEEILTATQGKLLQAGALTAFGDVVTDSRAVVRGAVFVALKGARFDAHQFLPQAIRRGARCLVVDKVPRCVVPRNVTIVKVRDTLGALGALGSYRRHLVAPKVLAITGSNGKTTTKEMVAAILQHGSLQKRKLQGQILKTVGNYNNLVGVPLTLLRLTGNERVAVLELGTNHPGEIRRLTEIADPDVALITAIAPAHLEGLRSVAGVAREKAALFQRLHDQGIAVFNADDPWVRRIGEGFSGRTIAYGRHRTMRAEKVKALGARGTSFVLRYGSARQPVHLALPGKHNVRNALGAAAMTSALGISLRTVAKGLRSVKPLPMRMELQRWNRISIINDAYNANPASMASALATLAELGRKGHRIAILGDMLELGTQARRCHFELGKQVARYRIDRLFLLGANAAHVRRGALAGGMVAEGIFIGEDHEHLARLVSRRIRAGDWLLIKGSRGMKMENAWLALKRLGD
jgi:UDP-N-acetylmuramoyl-tripeptide--D-alanyl-D-alanine ligase